MADLPILDSGRYPELIQKYEHGIRFFGRDYVESRLRQLLSKKDKEKKIVVTLKQRWLVEQEMLIKAMREVISKCS